MLQVILSAANDITMLQEADDLAEALCHALVEVRNLFQDLGCGVEGVGFRVWVSGCGI